MLTLVQRVRYMGVNGDNSGVKDVSLGEFQSQDI
jgi:hypothetical protein